MLKAFPPPYHQNNVCLILARGYNHVPEQEPLLRFTALINDQNFHRSPR